MSSVVPFIPRQEPRYIIAEIVTEYAAADFNGEMLCVGDSVSVLVTCRFQDGDLMLIAMPDYEHPFKFKMALRRLYREAHCMLRLGARDQPVEMRPLEEIIIWGRIVEKVIR